MVFITFDKSFVPKSKTGNISESHFLNFFVFYGGGGGELGR